MQGFFTAKGNAKLGPRLGAVNRMAIDTCPGASDWCKSVCYADRYINGRYSKTIRAAYTRQLTLPAGKLPRAVRIHASGDFDTVTYVEHIRAWVKAHPETLFWAYTRSWRVDGLLESLESLRSEPNMQLFASVDSSITETPPDGWRVAYIVGDARYRGAICMEQTGTKPDCDACGFCFQGQSKNIGFMAH
jgi:hypothetical protein